MIFELAVVLLTVRHCWHDPFDDQQTIPVLLTYASQNKLPDLTTSISPGNCFTRHCGPVVVEACCFEGGLYVPFFTDAVFFKTTVCEKDPRQSADAENSKKF